jgi:hypothetical protein
MARADHGDQRHKEDGKSFTGDKDKRSWKLVNPEAVKGH